MKRWLCVVLIALLVLSGCQSDIRPTTGTAAPVSTAPSRLLSATGGVTTPSSATTHTPPSVTLSKAEKRGVWISYYELDTLLKGKTPAQAGAAIDEMMRTCAGYGLNMVFFHVRANSDAYYTSSVYPAAPSVQALLKQGFDPLQRAIEAAHRYQLELHAWINPYRIGKDPARKRVNHVFSYQDVYYYMPHEPAVQQLVVKGVKEIVDGYDIDGVQFDDYFYPAGALPEDAPAAFEKSAYAVYQKKQEQAGNIAAWRRSGVDTLIRAVYRTVHTRSDCVFGVSPSHDAEQARDTMYADVAAWMDRDGMVDYMCPQVYFGFENEKAPFHRVVDIWRKYPRRASVRLYIGLALYKVGQEDTYAGAGEDEWQTHDTVIARSVNWLRTRKDCDGFMFFSYRYFTPASCGLSKEARQIAEREVEQVLALMR